MPRLTATQKISIFTTAVFLVSVGLFVLFYKHMSELRVELDTARVDYAVLMQRGEREQALEALVSKTETLRTELKERFLSVDNPIPFIDLVESLGSDVGVVLEVQSLNEEEDKEDSSVQTFVRAVLSVTGEWGNVYNLIVLLESLPYVTAIEKVAVEEKETNNRLVWEGQIHLRANIHP